MAYRPSCLLGCSSDKGFEFPPLPPYNVVKSKCNKMFFILSSNGRTATFLVAYLGSNPCGMTNLLEGVVVVHWPSCLLGCSSDKGFEFPRLPPIKKCDLSGAFKSYGAVV